jgi:hypothetical protein
MGFSFAVDDGKAQKMFTEKTVEIVPSSVDRCQWQ